MSATLPASLDIVVFSSRRGRRGHGVARREYCIMHNTWRLVLEEINRLLFAPTVVD
jgi:hypothetical protein